MAVHAINPFTGQLIEEIQETPVRDLPGMVLNAREAAKAWKDAGIQKRVKILTGLVPLIEKNKQNIAKTIHEEVGKPLNKALGEVEGTCSELLYYLEAIPKALEDQVVENNENETNIIVYDPIGVVAAITPWNFPFDIPAGAVIPALIAGNAVLFKPSEHTTLSGIALFQLLEQLEKDGLPKNCVQLVIGKKDVGKALVNQSVDMVSFTGSLRAGKQIMRDSAEHLHKILFELGGKDPAIVLKDCDIKKTAVEIVAGATRNTGQVCCSIERVYVEKTIFETFVKAVVEEAKKITVDPGDKPDADVGPLIREFQRKIVEEHVCDAVEKGATILLGGKKPVGPGFFYPVTILTNVNHSMKVMTEETFGPVIPLMPVDSVEQAVEFANNSCYGLTASVWTKNPSTAADIAAKLVTGTVTINRRGGSKYGCPWGGAKQSGIGRLYTPDGIRMFCNTKHVWVSKK